MKKFFLLIIITIFITGCSIKKIDTADKDSLISFMTNENYKLYNRYSIGYKYYLPKGVSLINYGDYNEQLLSNGNIYYLYIDITSYYYKKEMNIEKCSDCDYYKQINNDNKKGFVKVKEHDNDRYYVIYQYNYAKIESIIDKKNIDETLINMGYILASIKYNDSIIKNIIDNNIKISNEETFNLKKPNNNESTFLDYVNTYDKYNKKEEDKNKIDDESIIINNDEINE